MSKNSFIIGAPSSGSGKTMITLGLLRALHRRGLHVQPFKCGPDYIDPMYHTLAAQRESVNLDPYMATANHLREVYSRYSASADVAPIEGVMGLLDGYCRDNGSTAELSRLLNRPVIMVVDARSAAYSVAAQLYGFRHFGQGVNIVGVIFNRVASPSHYAFLKQAALDAGTEPLGYLPRNNDFIAPSRHLGLSTEAVASFNPIVEKLADAVTKHIDLSRLLELTACESPLTYTPQKQLENKGWRIAVARDEAFNFIYRANLDRLQESGSLSFFSPLRDATLPDADLIYLPGGYPEFFLEPLEKNVSLRREIQCRAENGGRILAECGGMMYLCRAIRSSEGKTFEMCGILPTEASMEDMRLRLGYREIRTDDGFSIRGHEFHYSHLTEELPSAVRQISARGEETATGLYRYKNVIAGYTHLYWGECNPLSLFEETDGKDIYTKR